MLTVKGTKSKKLIEYIERLYNELQLVQTDAIVDVNIIKQLDWSAVACCSGDTDAVEIEIGRLDNEGVKFSVEELMCNLAHEFIHAKQFTTGRLIDHGCMVVEKNTTGEKQTISVHEWEGELYKDTPYMEQPWEIEAYAQEEALFERCK